MKTQLCLGLLAAAVLPPAAAQETACPRLPPDSGLQWQRSTSEDITVCRAMDGDRQVMGMMFTLKPTFRPRPGDVREGGNVGAYEVRWHQPEIAAGDPTHRRVAVIKLARKNHVQLWIDAADEAELWRLMAVTQGIALY